MMYRQGDVLLQRVGSAALGEEIAREGGRIVLAHGEVSGHAHAIQGAGAALFRSKSTPAERFLKVTAPVDLVHEEHSRIPLPVGLYRVRVQREWSDDDEPIQVAD